MQNLHSNLKREHKLKHWGRLQYGLFLKGAVSCLSTFSWSIGVLLMMYGLSACK